MVGSFTLLLNGSKEGLDKPFDVPRGTHPISPLDRRNPHIGGH
jgi:hypothetical protein